MRNYHFDGSPDPERRRPGGGFHSVMSREAWLEHEYVQRKRALGPMSPSEYDAEVRRILQELGL